MQIPLSAPVFYILLCLHIKESHGYDIMKQVASLSDGAIKLGPGTLYGAISRMLRAGMIEESDERPDPALDDQRRKYYRITWTGQSILEADLDRLQKAILAAQDAKLHHLQTVWQ